MNVKEENNKQFKTMYENLKSMRQSKGWSIEELSEISGIHKKILTRIENGEDITLQHLFRLCRIYEVSLHEIFFCPG